MRTANAALVPPQPRRVLPSRERYRAATVTEPPRYRAATVRERSANAIATIESINEPEQILYK